MELLRQGLGDSSYRQKANKYHELLRNKNVYFSVKKLVSSGIFLLFVIFEGQNSLFAMLPEVYQNMQIHKHRKNSEISEIQLFKIRLKSDLIVNS